MGQLTDVPAKVNGTAMGAFGDRLRREREMRGITLDEITESTKISRRHLEALEGEHFDQLPGGVFNKGFVRAYAHFLGIDEDQAVADYSAAANEQPEPEDKFPLEIHEEPDPDLNPRRSYLPLVFAVAALVGVLVGYAFWVKSKPRTPDAAAATASQTTPQSASGPAASGPAASVPGQTAPQSTPVAGASVAATKAKTPAAPAKTPAAQVERAAVEPPVQTQPQAPATAAETRPAEKEKAFFVSVKAKEDAWISIVADGKSVMQRVLGADKHKKVKAGKVLVLRTGNAGGIEVSFNGRSLGAIGNENEPRTLTFKANGLVQ
ncbi:MAG TPA: RodZ domain-containing protein [Candidatus Angelobacter sp.]|nr:RodZ domain-containing protein [Candidatus Angelobacter sp.]